MFILIIRISYMQGLISSMSKSFSLYAFNNIVIKISILDIPIFGNLFSFRNLKSDFIKKRKLQLTNDNITLYQSLSDDNINEINITNDFEGSNINLGDCEKKLRDYYDIPEDTELTIIKLDFKKNDSKISQVQYEIFNPKNRSENLDLSICSQDKIKVINPIDVTSNKLNNIIESTQNNIQFTDLSEALYKDICSQFLSENGAYVLTQDRMIDYNYEEQYCQKGCTMQNINITSGTVACLCPPMNGLGNITFENEEEKIEDNIYKENNLNINNKEKDKYNIQKYSNTNIKALKCIKNIFGSGFSKNYILIIYTILLITYLILFTVSLFFLKPNNKNQEENKNNANPPKNENDNKVKKDKKENSVKKGKKSKKETNVKKQEDKTGKKAQIVKIENKKGDLNSKEQIIEKHKVKDNNNDNPDKMSFSEAKKEDRKPFIYWLQHSLIKRLTIISFLYKKDNSLILKSILLILSFINYTAVNTFFVSEKNIHQIYLDNNLYNFSYQFKYIISSLFISLIFFSLAKIFYNEDKSKNIIMKNKLMIAYIISSVIFIFYWLYIGAVTSLYINIKNHLIINIILCFVFDIIIEILLSLISAILRYTSFKFDKEILYNISKIINLY